MIKNLKKTLIIFSIILILIASCGIVSAASDVNDDFSSSADSIDESGLTDSSQTVDLNMKTSEGSTNLEDSSDDLNDVKGSSLTDNDNSSSDLELDDSDLTDFESSSSNLELDDSIESDSTDKEEFSLDEKKLNAYRSAYFSISTYNFDYGEETPYVGVALTYSGSYLYKYAYLEIWNDTYSDTEYFYTSSSGTKYVYFYDLGPGTYKVRAYFDGDSTYYSTSSSTYSFTVNPSTPSYPVFTINVSDIDYGDTEYVYTTLTNDYGNYLYKYVSLHVWSSNGYDVNRTFYTSSSSSKSSSFYDLEPGTYNVKASFDGDSKYYSTSSATYTFKVTDTRTYPVFNITVKDIEYGGTETIYIKLLDNYGDYLSKTVSLRVWSSNGYDESRSVSTSYYGSTSASFSSLSTGTYNVRASFDGDYSYRPVSSNTYTFLVTPPKKFSTLYLDASDSLEGSSVFNISLSNDNGYSLSGKTVLVSIYNSSRSYDEHFTVKTNSNGKYSLVVKNITPGYYYIYAEFEGDSTYYSTSDSASFRVFSKDTSISVEAESCVVGESAEIAINLYDANSNRISGNVNVYVDNVFYGSVKTDADMTIYYNIDGLKDGNFLIKVSFAGNSSYRSSEGYDNLKVYKISKLNATVKDFVYGTQGVLNVSLTDDKNNILNKNFTVKIYDENNYLVKSRTINGNEYIILYSSDFTEDRTYYVQTRFSGDDVYYPSYYDTEFRVLTKNTHIEFYIPHPATDEDVKAYVTLYDDGYNPIAGTVTVMIDNKTYTVKTKAIEENLISLGKLTEGNHTVTASFKGNETYFSTNYTDTFRIYKGSNLIINTNDIKSGQDAVLNFVLKGTDGKALNGQIYVAIESMYIGDFKDYIVNISNGKGVLKLSGVKTNYAVYARYDGDDKYVFCKQIEFIRIKKASSVKISANNINYGSDEVITVNLLGDNKNITDVVKVSVANKNYDVSVNNGKGTLTIKSLAVGKYNAIVYYKGNNIYLESSAGTSFTVNPISSKIIYSDMVTTAVASEDGRIGKYFEVKLVDSNGKALANKAIQIGFNGRIYNRTTDSNGGARLQINLAKADAYTFAVAYLGDDTYKGSFIVAKITVNRQTPKLTAAAKTFKNTTKVKTLSATLKTASGKAVSGKSLVFILNGKLYSAKTNSKGVATVNVSLNKKGTYNCVVKLSQTDTFKAVSTKFTVKIV